MVCDLDRVIVILARHLYREVSVGLVCYIWYRVKVYSTVYIYGRICVPRILCLLLLVQ